MLWKELGKSAEQIVNGSYGWCFRDRSDSPLATIWLKTEGLFCIFTSPFLLLATAGYGIINLRCNCLWQNSWSPSF